MFRPICLLLLPPLLHFTLFPVLDLPLSHSLLRARLFFFLLPVYSGSHTLNVRTQEPTSPPKRTVPQILQHRANRLQIKCLPHYILPAHHPFPCYHKWRLMDQGPIRTVTDIIRLHVKVTFPAVSVSAITFIGAVADTSRFPSTTDTDRGFPDDREVSTLVLTFFVFFVLLVGFTPFVIGSVAIIARVT